MAPIQSNGTARLAHTPKKFLVSGLCSPLNMNFCFRYGLIDIGIFKSITKAIPESVIYLI